MRVLFTIKIQDFQTQNFIRVLADTFMPELKFESIILVDPTLWRGPVPEEVDLPIEIMAAKRKDVWRSREEARKFFHSRAMFTVWDPKVLDVYIVRPSFTHDLRSHHM